LAFLSKKTSDESKNVKQARRFEPKDTGELVKPHSFPVVGIGASAGGLEALKVLLENLPVETGLAFVIIQHLAAGQVSMLTEILARSTVMPVLKVTDGMAVEPNHVYVIPPDKSMTIVDDDLLLHPRNSNLKPIDSFLTSLAVERKTHAIGVVLSGTGADGTEGLKAIKAEGGITFAQDPDTAQYTGMPQSAIAAETAYFILGPDKIAMELARISRHPQIIRAELRAAEPKFTKEGTLKTIFTLLKSSFGVDFTHYKESTISRRITRRMVISQIETMKGYVDYLRAYPKELQSLFDDMLIGVTSFFREPNTFLILKERVFPEILKIRTSNAPIRIWVPGCSSGEEVYSLAITLQEFLEEKNQPDVSIQIFGTDVNERNIERSRQGIYAKNIESYVSDERLRRFFAKVNGNYQIAKFIRDMCIFAKQDVTKDPPFSNLDMICCRNVLIYFDNVLQDRVIPILHYALKPNGFLILGESESVGKFTDLFGAMEKKGAIFVKKRASSQVTFGFEAFQIASKAAALREPEKKDPMALLRDEVDKLVMSRYVPAMILVNKDLDILIFRGHMGPYILPESGTASLNVSKMLCDELRLEVQTGIYRARKENKPVSIDTVTFVANDDTKTVNLEVIPVRTKNFDSTFFLVLFREPPPSIGLSTSAIKTSSKQLSETEKHSRDKQLQDLQEELDSTKQSLQTIIEEQEATNEELRAAMEEVQSSNEELQSTNEELETAKEELQSTNEELKTLNDELKNRNVDLARLNDDLTNLIKNIDIALIMVDNSLKIRRFTPLAQDTLGLIPSDIGRSITNIRFGIPVKQIEKMITEVISKLSTIKLDIQDPEGRWFELRIRPYITEEKRIDGAVISFIDIDEIKKAQNSLVVEAEKYRTLAENSPEVIARFNKNLQLTYLSPSAQQALKLTPDKALNHTAEQIDILKPIAEHLHQALLASFTHRMQQSGEIELQVKDESKVFKYTIAPEISLSNVVESAVCIMSDITELKTLEQSLREHSENLEDIVREKTGQLKDAERLAAIGETAGMVGHDIRNPLQTITSSIYLSNEEVNELPEGDTKENLKDNLDQMEQQVEYINKIVADLQDYARPLSPEIKEYDLKMLIEDSLAVTNLPANIKITTRLPPDLPSINADISYFKRTLLNLLSNSIQAMPNGGEITIAAQAKNRKIRLSVHDTGTGISEVQQKRIFQPLFTTKSKGQGFGLAVCKRLMDAQKSGITFESHKDKGTTFILEFSTAQ
jgi:two-component system CheB/CheR fusion protein